jgi:ABC-type antimicrobial peptide transport system permease subunit
LGQGIAVLCVGLAAGVLLSIASAPAVRGLLIGISATDPLIYAEGAVLLSTVTLLACYLPLRRAMRLDPMVALRYE